MKLRNISIIIRREYLNKVRKKSFLVTTFLVPVLFAALCVLPSVIMLKAKEETKTIAVIDNSGIVMPTLENTDVSKFLDMTKADLAEVKGLVSEGNFDAVLNISAIDPVTLSVKAETYSLKPLGLDLTESLSRKVNKAVESYRIDRYDIPEFRKMMEDVHSDVKITTITLDESGKETVSESGVYMVVSLVLGMIIYLFVVMFCGSVMSSVIEEKSSRVVEVLISSVKSTELMFGKIIGVALVAVTQFLLWVVLASMLIGGAAAFVGPEKMAALTGGDAAMTVMGTDQIAEAMPKEATVIFSTLANIPWGEVVLAFVLFFLFGYLLYASMFAAIGSAVESEADSQQLQMPLTVPLLLGFFITLYAFKAPGSQVVLWASMIPFTSPIVMLARLPFGVPFWQLAVSIGLLIVTFALFAYLSAKIYKVGILMFGKKPTWQDLLKWLKMK